MTHRKAHRHAPARAQRGQIHEGLERAEQAQFTRPIPKSPGAQLRFLLAKARGSTKAVAGRLGISQHTVQRYQQGTIDMPRTATAKVMDQETAKEWQPQVCAQARARASITGGPTITAWARFGFRAGASTSNDSRIRLIRQPVSPS
ncbi:telomere-protecting terminal protein Tpg [Streptomyces atratus]|uniref:telomere-protecting terminal protein Tpg n=1 Tax=Streptomyces atratus TaxID=1893 RepID=UPI0022566984|nr:terminal protein [Streptomyces atratus]MCX5346033.1 helix-turn-helix domain-containing protein [Streptomyces atratus]